MATSAVPIQLDPDPFRKFNISAGFKVGDLLFLSGHVPIDTDGKPVKGDFDEQAELTIKNLEKTLRQAGSSLERVIKLTIYVTNIRVQRTKIMELRRKWFKPPYPADTLVEVSALGDPSRLLEIDAIALVSGQIER